jgi:hypothetical protein
MATKGIPQRYSASMEHYKLGYAFYEPESSLAVTPGSCGYIDDSGSWHRIVDITDDIAVQKAGFQKMNKTYLIQLPPSKRFWGPKCTETVEDKGTTISAGVSGLPAGIPAGASFLIQFTLHSDFGAVLMCKDEVHKQGYEHADPFKDWAKANATKIAKALPSVRKYGFYIAIATHSAKEVFINGMMRQGRTVALGFKTKIEPHVELAAAAECYGADAASGWVKPICEGQLCDSSI